VEVVVSLSQGRTAAAQCGLFTHKSVPVIFEPPCILRRTVFVDAILVHFMSFNYQYAFFYCDNVKCTLGPGVA